jgi:uncharacterized protein
VRPPESVATARCAEPAAEATRIILRPVATPFPLGFAALAIASLLVAGLELGWFPDRDQTVVAITLIGFSFPLQLLGSIVGFLGRDTSAATGFGVQGATWLIVGIELLLSAPGRTSVALGVLLLAAGAWVAICATGAALGKLVPAAVLGLTALRFALTGLYELTAASGVEHLAAVVGLVLVVAAAYAGLALEIENLRRRTVLPLARRGDGRAAMDEGLAAQAARIEHEAGVRAQL